MENPTTTLLDRRRHIFGDRFSVFYQKPVYLVRGEGVWVWDNEDKRYLDSYNNVPLVGHCHPKVVEAICQQSATLNTHTRYLHHRNVEYGEHLLSLLAPSLNAMLLTCTGSEANDLALRLAQVATGKTGVICTSQTYHGNTTAVSQLSMRKPPIGGYSDSIRHVRPPNDLEPIGLEEGLSQAQAFAQQVDHAIEELQQQKCGFSALILCPLFANEGFPTLEPGFLDETVKRVRAAGGVVIADEVQSGFGRTGTHMWAHERLGFVPDILTLGKPMASGYPVGAVLTERDLLNNFQASYSYFNTFGGNPVASAAAHSTLKVFLEEDLMANAQSTGEYALQQLQKIKARHPVVASVRGAGLFFGAELASDPATASSSASELTRDLAEAMKDKGVLVGISGPKRTILKIRPPLPYGIEHVDRLSEALDCALTEVLARAG